MNEIQLIASEAYKLFCEGKIYEHKDVHYMWNYGKVYYDCKNLFSCTWGCGTLGALFIGYMKINGVITRNDSFGNFWTNEFIENTLSKLPFFQVDTARIPRIKEIEGYTTGMYQLLSVDTTFKKTCNIKLKHILHSLITKSWIDTSYWSM